MSDVRWEENNQIGNGCMEMFCMSKLFQIVIESEKS